MKNFFFGGLLLLFAGCEKFSRSPANDDFSWGDGFEITKTIQTNLQATMTVEFERFYEGTNLVFEVESRQTRQPKFTIRHERLYLNNKIVAEVMDSTGTIKNPKTGEAINAYGEPGIRIVSSVNHKGKFIYVAVETEDNQSLAACWFKESRLWPVSARTLAKHNAFMQNLSTTFKDFIDEKDTPDEFMSNVEKLKQEAQEIK